MKYRALGLICGRAKRYDTLHKLAMGKPKKQAALELDLNSYELRRGGRVIPLERQPMELLILLADRHGQLVTRDEIGLRLWGPGGSVGAEPIINNCIYKLRLLLGHSCPN